MSSKHSKKKDAMKVASKAEIKHETLEHLDYVLTESYSKTQYALKTMTDLVCKLIKSASFSKIVSVNCNVILKLLITASLFFKSINTIMNSTNKSECVIFIYLNSLQLLLESFVKFRFFIEFNFLEYFIDLGAVTIRETCQTNTVIYKHLTYPFNPTQNLETIEETFEYLYTQYSFVELKTSFGILYEMLSISKKTLEKLYATTLKKMDFSQLININIMYGEAYKFFDNITIENLAHMEKVATKKKERFFTQLAKFREVYALDQSAEVSKIIEFFKDFPRNEESHVIYDKCSISMKYILKLPELKKVLLLEEANKLATVESTDEDTDVHPVKYSIFTTDHLDTSYLENIDVDESLIAPIQSFSSQSDVLQSETSQPETSQPETSQSDTSQSDILQSDILQSEQLQPDTPQSDVLQSELSQSELSQSDTSQSDVLQSNASQPDALQPDTPQSEMCRLIKVLPLKSKKGKGKLTTIECAMPNPKQSTLSARTSKINLSKILKSKKLSFSEIQSEIHSQLQSDTTTFDCTCTNPKCKEFVYNLTKTMNSEKGSGPARELTNRMNDICKSDIISSTLQNLFYDALVDYIQFLEEDYLLNDNYLNVFDILLNNSSMDLNKISNKHFFMILYWGACTSDIGKCTTRFRLDRIVEKYFFLSYSKYACDTSEINLSLIRMVKITIFEKIKEFTKASGKKLKNSDYENYIQDIIFVAISRRNLKDDGSAFTDTTEFINYIHSKIKKTASSSSYSLYKTQKTY